MKGGEVAFGPFRLDRSNALLWQGEKRISLPPKPFEVLCYLAGRPGELVTKNELLSAVWPNVNVGDASLTVAINTLRTALGEEAASRRYVETVPKRGYRFVATISLVGGPFQPQNFGSPSADPNLSQHEEPTPNGANSPLEAASQKAPRLSLVVLPFNNIGGDPEQEFFVEGVTESLTTDISRVRGVFVIGRNTAFTYKGKIVDLKRIGRELNVRYVLEGSVQRGGSWIRVNVQLIDAESGLHLWAERFDKPLAGLFDMQDEIVARLAGALSTQLVNAEAIRSAQAPSPDSMDLYFQGRAWLNKGHSPENVAIAQELFEQALAADSGNIEALVWSAFADVINGAATYVADPVTALLSAERKAKQALALVPEHSRGHLALGIVYNYTRRATEGIAECEHALALDRNLAAAHASIGIAKVMLGRSEETEAHIAEALRQSPRDTLAYSWLAWAGVAHNEFGRWERAIPWFRRSIEANRNYPGSHLAMAAALANLGRIEEAKTSIETCLALNPSFSIARARASWTAMIEDIAFSTRLEPILNGLRLAGLPEE